MNLKDTGELIRKVRKERGMTQDDLAELTNIPRTTLSAIERGLTCNPIKVQCILQKLDISITDLSEKDKEETEDLSLDLTIIENKINSKPRDALAELAKLSATSKGQLLDFLKGRCYYKVQQYDRAVDFFYKALNELEKLIDDRSNLKPCCLLHLSIIEFKKGNKETALRHAQEGLDCFNLQGDYQHYYVTFMLNKAIYLRSLGRAEEAIQTLEQTPIHSSDISSDAVIGIYDLRAKLKLEIMLYDEALNCAKNGLKIAQINYNIERQVELYITMGDIYKESRKLDRAKKCLLAAIDLKDEITRRQWLILEAYAKLGIVYFEKKDFHLSNKILQKALKFAKQENDMLKYSKALLYIGKSFLSELNYPEACTKFLEIYELQADKKTVIEALFNLSQTYLLLGDRENYDKYSELYFKFASEKDYP